MKILFIILTFFICINSFSLTRKIFVHEIFYSHSNDINAGAEISILVTNISPVAQTIDFSNLFAEVIYKTVSGENRKVVTTAIAKQVGASINPSQRTTSLINPVQILGTTGQNFLQIIMSISPQALAGPYLGRKTLGGLNPNEIGAGDNVNIITITGYLLASDSGAANAPGSVVASGSIIKPSDVSGFQTTDTIEFRINNGKPF